MLKDTNRKQKQKKNALLRARLAACRKSWIDGLIPSSLVPRVPNLKITGFVRRKASSITIDRSESGEGNNTHNTHCHLVKHRT